MRVFSRFMALLQTRMPRTPLIEIHVSQSALLHNLATFRARNAHIEIAPVLKSNAYGHGLLLVAKVFDRTSAPFFVVDSLYEALFLKAHGVEKPILVVGYTTLENIVATRDSGIIFTITSIEQLRALASHVRRKQSVHLKIDTGMHRQGISVSESDACIELLRMQPHLVPTGICTHFADADGKDTTFTQGQIAVWNTVVEKFQNAFSSIREVHIGGTSGFHFTSQAKCTTLRVGLGIYGINPSPHEQLELRPVLSMYTVISSVRTIERGESVGYNHTFTAGESLSVATIPVGYFEGLDRRLSSNGFVYIHNRRCPIVGRISMNIASVDVTGVTDTSLGTKVVVMSSDRNHENSVEKMAVAANTIPYEILVHIPAHLRRILSE